MSMQEAIEQAAERARKAPGAWDYLDPEDNLLHCGTCGKPKEKRVEFPPGKVRIFPVLCDCWKKGSGSYEEKAK